MKKYFPYLVLFAALLISCTGSFFSIYGLGKIFGGHQVGATILAFSFEFGNIIGLTALKIYWKHLPSPLKIFLIVVIVVSTGLTSMGIYGYLSDGYQKTAMKDEMVTRKANLVKSKKDNFTIRIDDYKNELQHVNGSISELTKGLNTNSQTQQVVKGKVITNVQVTSKKSIDNQLSISNERKVSLNSKIESLQDSVQRLELQIIEIEASNTNASELGPLKYLATLTGTPMNKIVNWLILLIVVVFQPLAIMLILTSMFAFKNNHYLIRKPRITKYKPTKSTVVPTDVQLSPEVPVNNSVKPKRKYKKKVVVDQSDTIEFDDDNGVPLPIDEEIIVEAIAEPLVEEKSILDEATVEAIIKKHPSKRKIVDTDLTSNIAAHIEKSIPVTKKKD